jgi:peptidoglycan hydrolase-like amidase
MESLKAGAIAIRTYALYWVLRGGKYKCADLCDTTMSQRYKVKHTKRTDKAVNETKGQVIINKNNNEIIQSEYCAENGYITKYNVVDAVCKGYVRDGHGRGMCQWGSMRWASETGGNKKYKWIIEHYYPECAVINKR